MHVFFWGDVHRKNLGEERANFISPMVSAMDLGLKATNHTDFNVTPLDPFMVLGRHGAAPPAPAIFSGPASA